MYFQLLKKIVDILSPENIISDIEPNVSNKQEKFWCKSLHIGYDFVWNPM